MEIRQSAEDYLESILVLSKKGGGVRSIDIATRLGVSKPSVSHAMKLLREDGYIAMDRYGTVTLLEKGQRSPIRFMSVTLFLPGCWRTWGSGRDCNGGCLQDGAMTSARRALIRSRHIIITSLRRKKQQNKKHACRQAAGR